jgi:lipoprotein-anchoring transpeptidase ErfK/SrfK
MTARRPPIRHLLLLTVVLGLGSAAPATAAPAGGRTLTAALTGPAQLRASPGGRVVATVGTSTEYGSRRVYRVVGRRGGWLAVLAPERPNGRAGWIPAGDAVLGSVTWAIEVDRSSRHLTLRRAGRTVRRIRVTIGAHSSPTPLGRFAVTDKLRMGPRSIYGCCALALSGNQTRGRLAGVRLAIHGTPRPEPPGGATSNGCVHVNEPELRRLMRTVPLATPVTVVR